MRKSVQFLFLITGIFFISFTTSSCHRGTGCRINENAHVQPNKKGKYAKTKTKSGLFPKKMLKHR
jgi:hypothetical protein